MRLSAWTIAGLLLATAVTSSCDSAVSYPSGTPDSEEARRFFAQIIQIAHSGDLAELCTVGGGNCDQILTAAGRDVPAEPPAIIGERVLEATYSPDGSRTAGGRVLVVCGHKLNGEAYRTEILIFAEDGRLVAIEPVYWSGLTVAAGAGGEASTPPSPNETSCS